MKIPKSRNLLILMLFCTFGVSGQEIKNVDSLLWINQDVYRFHKTRLNLLGLDTSIGFDSLRIRIFIDRSLCPSDNILELSNSQKKWRGKIIKYHLGYNRNDEKFFVDKTKKATLKPNIPWDSLISKLINNDLLVLHDDDLIDSYPLTVDGVSYCVEISTKNNVRFYCFTNPELAKKTIKDAQKMCYILDLIYSHFKLLNKY